MKKRREEKQRKKTEERARKAELRAKEKAVKEAKKANKGKGKQPANVGSKRSQNARRIRPTKHPCVDTNFFTDGNDNECCVCYVAYDNDQSGKDWVDCVCGQWHHEDCVDDCVVDSDGNRRLYFICLDQECYCMFVSFQLVFSSMCILFESCF